MKYILLFTASIFLFSCTKAKKNEKNIVGTWNISEFYNSYETPTYYGDTSVYGLGQLIFNNDGTGKFDAPLWSTDSFSWTNDKNYIYLEFNINDKDTLKITDISKTNMILEDTDSIYSISGFEKYKYKYTLTK